MTRFRGFARLAVRVPFPWPALLGYLAPRLIGPVERVDAGAWYRRVDDGELRVQPAADGRLQLAARGTIDTATARARVIALFDPSFDAGGVLRALAGDALLAPCLAAAPGLRPLGAWSAFELVVRTIVGQQVTVAAAGTLTARLAARCGSLTPAALLGADLAQLGMPGRRVATLRGVAQAALDGRLPLEADWAEVDAALAGLPGIGPWTRGYLAIRLGRQPDAFPETDLGLIRAAGAASAEALLRRAEAWRPWRAHAATYLWRGSAPAGFDPG